MLKERFEIVRQVSMLPTNSFELRNQTSTPLLQFEKVLPRYVPFCEDFVPQNPASVLRFCQLIQIEKSVDLSRNVVVVSSQFRRSLTNAVFLLGAYMIKAGVRSSFNTTTVGNCRELSGTASQVTP